jgi:hypothetical protein
MYLGGVSLQAADAKRIVAHLTLVNARKRTGTVALIVMEVVGKILFAATALQKNSPKLLEHGQELYMLVERQIRKIKQKLYVLYEGFLQ